MQLNTIIKSNVTKEFGLLCLVLLFAPQVSANNVKTIINDMRLPHAALPGNATSSHNSIGAGPKVTAGINPPVGWSAISAWGEIYPGDNISQDSDTRIQLRNINAYVLSKSTHEWSLLQHSVPVIIRRLDESGRTVDSDVRSRRNGSVAVKLANGQHLSFTPMTSKASVDPDDIAAIFTTVQARLVPGSQEKTKHKSASKYFLQMGGDYSSSLNDEYMGGGVANTSVGYGRIKNVTAKWQDFNFTTLDSDQAKLLKKVIKVIRQSK